MKRFTDTDIWDRVWFRKLPNRLKSMFRYLCDRCDPAGVMDPDWEAVSFYVGEPCSEEDLAHFNGNIVMRKGKVYIPKFVEFQYGKLSRECKPHIKVFEAIERHGLDAMKLAPNQPELGLPVKTHPKVNGDFDAFWQAYPRKVGKGAAEKAWKKNGRPELAVILAAVEKAKGCEQWRKDGGQFIPHPATWLNQKRWEDETQPVTAESCPTPMTDEELIRSCQ